jgi:hypothetical protein
MVVLGYPGPLVKGTRLYGIPARLVSKNTTGFPGKL